METTTTTTTETPQIKLHFLDYWRVIRLRKSLILTVFLLCVICSAFLTYWLPKQYESTVTMEVQKDAPEIAIAGSQVSQSWDPYYLATQFKIIRSWGILTNVIIKLNLTHELAHQADDSDWSLDDTFMRLDGRLNVNQNRGTSLIDISIRNPDPQLAADIVNKIAETYRDYRLENWRNNHSMGLASLEQQLMTNYETLRSNTTLLDEMRASNNIPDLGSSGDQNLTVYDEAIRGLEIHRIDALVDYNDHNSILSNLLELQTNNNLLPDAINTALRGQADPELLTDMDRVHMAEDELTADSQLGYGPGSPQIAKARELLTQATNSYQHKIDGIMQGMVATVDHDKELLDTIVNEETLAKSNSSYMAARFRPYFSLKRQVDEDTRIDEELKRRAVDERAEADQPNMNVAIIHDPGRAEKHPVSPKAQYIIPIGVLLGLMVGVGLAFFIEYLDTSVKTIDDVERSLQAPVLGVIPQNVGNIMDEGADSPHAEAYRVLRTNLLFSRKDERWSTITVLSGGAGEGKTTTLFNTAVIFAQNGDRVLVVDSDLRRPSVHRMLKLPNTNGLTDLLLNKQVAIDQVIQKTKIPTLDYLPSGKLPSSSMSILSSPRMKELMQELKRKYDYVFFDSPPLLGVSDASVLASQVDMVLQVIQYRRYPQPMTLRAKQMIQKVGGNLMGLVLNNINMSQDENYYYYSGYYEYEYRTPKNDPTVVHLSDATAEPNPKVEIKKKY